MAEWLKAPAWKACILLKVSRVRIPFSPPKYYEFLIIYLLIALIIFVVFNLLVLKYFIFFDIILLSGLDVLSLYIDKTFLFKAAPRY